MTKKARQENIRLIKFAVGGQAIGNLSSGKKVFAWGGLPGEEVVATITKQKSRWAEAVVTTVTAASPQRVAAVDPDSYLSTSPWQILNTSQEDEAKLSLVKESFSQHHVLLPEDATVNPTHLWYGYRNKVEFSFYFDIENDQLELAFFRRGGRGKVPVEGTGLAMPVINKAASAILNTLRDNMVEGRNLKTLLIRAQQNGDVVAQLYVKDKEADYFNNNQLHNLPLKGLQVIYSNPLSPASVITEILHTYGDVTMNDTILSTPFTYACEGFFQVNLPVYEQALSRMANFVDPNKPTVDLYSGVGTIGLTIGKNSTILVEENAACVAEMKKNISQLQRDAHAVLASSELALEYINSDATVIVDPPRAGLHKRVVEKLLQEKPSTILYLSCNPATQARDCEMLLTDSEYRITHATTYNFFPRTPHIENLVVLSRA